MSSDALNAAATITCEWCWCEVRPVMMDLHLGSHIGSNASTIYHLNRPLYERALASAGAPYRPEDLLPRTSKGKP